jgi:hypothetical protein
MKNYKKILNQALILFGITAIGLQASAQSSTDLSTMFASFSTSGSALIKLAYYVSGIMGAFLCVSSVFKLVQVYGGHGGQLTVKTPIVTFFAGVALIAFTSTLNTVDSTLAMSGGGAGDVLQSGGSGASATMSAALGGIVTLIQLVGYISFIRGWLLINQYGQGKNEALGKAIIHLVGGALAINVLWTAQVLANTFAPGLSITF